MNGLERIESCIGHNGTITVTDGTRTSEQGSILRGNGINAAPDSQHNTGNAADFAPIPGVPKDKVLCCAKQSGFTWAHSDKRHIHVDRRSGGNGGELPKCGCQ
ncbi:MAG: D-Ala-D-Ala carboxypeptidase family metallohydrolase [Thermoplasmata archaeon]